MASFDAYLMVDWSAARRPVSGKDSIWWALVRGGRGGIRLVQRENPRTRAQATLEIADALAALSVAGARTLVGFDFPFGYPAGTAGRLTASGAGEHSGPAWRRTWRILSEGISDGADNANNRFDLAERLNRALSGEAFPFWGHDGRAERRFLLRGGCRAHGPEDVPKRRLCEARVRRTQPAWKLAGNGSVGGQALVGIPRVWQIRTDPRLAPVARIWPFETGLRPPAPQRGDVLIAEVYPSLVAWRPENGKVRDACQVRTIAEYFAALDAGDALAPLFAGDPGLTSQDRHLVEAEEAWILGVTDGQSDRKRTTRSEALPPEDARHQGLASKNTGRILRRVKSGSREKAAVAEIARFDYLREPGEIYRRSFELVRAEADVSGLPKDIAEVAVRLVHACGMPEIVCDLAWHGPVVAAARVALQEGAPIVADCRMVVEGINPSRLPARNAIICTLGEPKVPALARQRRTTRSAVAVDLWRPHLAGAVIAIGNAPTALFRLLEIMLDGTDRPAAILGFPVGFVGAAEAKETLIEAGLDVPYLTLRGRRGGSALAAAAVNALSARAQ